MREWWLRTLLVLQAPRPVFVALRDDTAESASEVMFEEYREKRFAPPPTLRKLVAAGHLGRKTGRGFYDYSGDEPVPLDRQHATD